MKDWFKNYLIQNSYVNCIPLIPSINFKINKFEEKHPISMNKDWPLISQYFYKYTNQINNINNKNRTIYYRHMLNFLITVSYDIGLYIKEILGNLEKVKKANSNCKYNF